MSWTKQIKSKIKSVWNIKKLTKALEIVSTVKLQKIKKKTEDYRSFMHDFLNIVHQVSTKMDIFDIPAAKTPIKRECVVVTSTEKGLCGSMNAKLFKHLHQKLHHRKDHIDVFCIGKKAVEFFVRSWFNVVWVLNIKDDFSDEDLNDLYIFLRDAIHKWTYSKIKIYFNYFKNIIKQTPLRFKLYPLDQDSFDKFTKDIGIVDVLEHSSISEHQEMLIEPSHHEVRNEIIDQMIQHIVYGAVLQNKAWEFAARMFAMKNASDNSQTLIKDLTLKYNKARQWAITQEISEIVSAKIALGG